MDVLNDPLLPDDEEMSDEKEMDFNDEEGDNIDVTYDDLDEAESMKCFRSFIDSTRRTQTTSQRSTVNYS